MFYDLNVPYSADDPEILHTLEFLAELGYTTVALSQTITGKIPPNAAPPSPPANAPKSLTLLSRVNIPLADPSQNQRLTALAETYSLVAVRPTNEKSLLNACNNLDCDLISLDFSERLPFHFKFKTLASAISRGVRFEICYGPGVTGSGLEARRNLIGNAMALIRATRGRGIIISSEAKRALGVRAPWDVINLACVWGLSQERGKEAICEEARKVTALARLKRSSWRGIVDVVHGGEKPKVEPAKTKKSAPAVSDAADSLKRKASLSSEPPAEESEKPLSKLYSHESEGQKPVLLASKLAVATASSPRPNNAIVNALWSATVLISNGSAVVAAAPPASAVALVVDVVDVAVVKVVLAAAAVVVAAAVVAATDDEDVAAEVDCCTAAELEACTAVLLSVWAATLLEEGTATLEDITAGVEPATTALDAGVMMVANVDARAAAELDGHMLKALAGQRQVQSQAPESDPALPAGVAAGTATADDDAATAAEDMAGVFTAATDDDAAIAATDDDAATAATEDDDVATAATDDDAAAAATEDDAATAATDDDAATAATDDDTVTAATDDDVATTATDDDAATA
ncbi:hypothetical protein DTO207G8_3246 [Paecilomyces variotii]|nr:hypothetical protein DTO169E5_5791 [Paecilomyces variotii]KAJ9255062.1 hypothetical protein DTO207G8_3246 [Paecilomyces variotii]